MNGFWHALARVNARYLSIGAAILLGLSLAAWLFSLGPHRSRETATAPPAPGRPSAAGEAPGQPGRGATNGVAPNPFESDHLSELVALSEEGLLQWNTPSSPPREAQPEPPPPEEPERPPEPRTVQLVYRGMIRRTDGTTVAMIEKDGEGRPTSYAAGAALIDGVQITEIGRSQLKVAVGDTIVTLQRGARKELEY